jgi:hypothetical protein
MKILSFCLTTLFFILTVVCLYKVFQIPKEWALPSVEISAIKKMQEAYIIHAIVSFVFFCASLYVAINRERLAKLGLLTAIFVKYILTIMITSFILVNG